MENKACKHMIGQSWDCGCSYGTCGLCHLGWECLECGAKIRKMPHGARTVVYRSAEWQQRMIAVGYDPHYLS